MKIRKHLVPVAAALLIGSPVAAQIVAQTNDDALHMEEEHLLLELESAERDMVLAERMRAAEARLEEAARQVAELSSRNLPQVARIQSRLIEFADRPRLGVSIGDIEEKGPVEGVRVVAVSPGGAAAGAGLRAGDIITSVNDESLSADDAEAANQRLLDFMKGVEEGDTLTVEYLRDGDVGSIEVEPRVSPVQSFAWAPRGRNYSVSRVPRIHVAPDGPEIVREFSFGWSGAAWGDMELVELSEGLARYFGTDSGLLVISAPKSNAFDLQDGDVIQRIDDREPKSVGHAMRILGSYQAGEKLELKIMRDKRRETLKIDMPDSRSSGFQHRHPREHVIPPQGAIFIP